MMGFAIHTSGGCSSKGAFFILKKKVTFLPVLRPIEQRGNGNEKTFYCISRFYCRACYDELFTRSDAGGNPSERAREN